jgi:hypothetical protein
MIQQMMNITPVIVTRGTPTHDSPGCYDIFLNIDALHNFTILEPSKSYVLYEKEGNVYESKGSKSTDVRLLIFGVPEPSKEWFLKDKQLGKEEGNEAIKEGMRALLLGLGATRKQYPDIPSLLVYHVMISGATLTK